MYSLLLPCFNMICLVDTCYSFFSFNLMFSLVVDNIIRLYLISYFYTRVLKTAT
jgi:hypothetical protein